MKAPLHFLSLPPFEGRAAICGAAKREPPNHTPTVDLVTCPHCRRELIARGLLESTPA